MQDIVLPLGEFIVKALSILEKMENWPNVLVIILGFVGTFYWLKVQKDYTDKAKKDGTLI
ncbi:MAG: hypothetical protein ACXITV_12505 [Luteibaculaceae bacterium]